MALASLVALMMSALSPVTAPHRAQGQCSMGGVGTDPVWNMQRFPGAAHFAQFDACALPGCAWSEGWPLTAVRREMSAGLLLGLSQVSGKLFQMSLMQKVWEGLGTKLTLYNILLSKALVVED